MAKVMRNLFYDSVKDFIDDVSKPPEGGWKLEYHKNRWQRLEASRAGSPKPPPCQTGPGVWRTYLARRL